MDGCAFHSPEYARARTALYALLAALVLWLVGRAAISGERCEEASCKHCASPLGHRLGVKSLVWFAPLGP